MEYVLLVGVHGVGKSYLLNELSGSISLHIISISDLIRKSGKKIDRGNKLVFNIKENQELWKEELKALSFNDGDLVVLDGHLSLLNQEGVIKKLPLSTFNGIKIKKIILKCEKPELIQERLYTRDGKKWTIDLITKFQQVEKTRAELLSKEYNIPLFIYENKNQLEKLTSFISE